MNIASTRQLKVSKLLQKELSDIFAVSGREMYGNALVSVTQVDVAKDFSFAKIWLSIYAVKDKKSVLDAINSNKKQLRFLLGQRIKNQMRVVPEINFAIDDTLDYIDNIDKLLKS